MGRRDGCVEFRTRSGCRKCRDRRVKCPEDRPICSHCRRLGFACLYETKLRWERPEVGSQPVLPASRIRVCMFLNTQWDDFCTKPLTQGSNAPSSPTARYSVSPKLRPAVPMPWDSPPSVCIPRGRASRYREQHDYQSYFGEFIGCLSPFNLKPDEHYLWNYFDSCIAPQCVQDPRLNPYRDVVLRIAATSKDGPLLHCVLAAAANQLYSIGLVEYKPAMWLHRARALHLLRTHVSDLAHISSTTSHNAVLNEQIVASTLMLCFFEISQNCSRSWTIHADFARSLLSTSLRRYELLSAEQQSLHHFAFTYFVSHDVFAATAGSPMSQNRAVAELCRFIHEPDILALTGCTKQLLVLISEVSVLGSLCEERGYYISGDLLRCRKDTERQLHQLRDEFVYPNSEELHTILEVKRLAALMYLYGRLDDAGPQEAHMVRITRQILELIQDVSLRTNALLWPLFIVGVMGIRSEDEEDRKLLLEKLAALQETRQLGNIKKARRVIEDVWKARDLHPSQAGKGWSILEGRYNAVSLA